MFEISHLFKNLHRIPVSLWGMWSAYPSHSDPDIVGSPDEQSSVLTWWQCVTGRVVHGGVDIGHGKLVTDW